MIYVNNILYTYKGKNDSIFASDFKENTTTIATNCFKNNKKLKYWFDTDQLEQIENLVKSASENAELKLETKRNKLVSFKVIDTLYDRVVFKGLFT
jgi:hypothetical protein